MQAQATNLQKAAVAKIHNLFAGGETSVLVQAMTGAGKTYIGFEFIRDYLLADASRKVMIVVPTVALVEQFHETAQRFGFIASVYHGTLDYRLDEKGNKVSMDYIPSARICITLPDTFAKIVEGTNLHGYDTSWIPTLLMMDEAHKNTSANSQAFKKFAPDAWVLGFTATPRRETNDAGEYLMDWYGDNLLIAASAEELIAAGRIVPPSIYEFKDSHNEFDEWAKLTAGHANVATIVIAKDTKSAVEYMNGFRKRFPNKVVDILTSVGDDASGTIRQTPKERQRIQNKFKNGHIDVLVSVDTICEGFDAPRAKFVMIMRNMTSEALYHQVVGRVLRMFTCPFTGEVKDAGYVMDFGGNHAKYGSVTERVWTPMDYAPETSIVTGERVTQGQHARAKTLMIGCRVCDKVYDSKARKQCPACQAPHNVYVAVKVKDIYEKVYGMNNPSKNDLRALGSMFASKHYSGATYMTMSTVYNEIFGCSVFTPKGACPKHQFFRKLVAANANLTATVKVPLSERYVLDKLAA